MDHSTSVAAERAVQSMGVVLPCVFGLFWIIGLLLWIGTFIFFIVMLLRFVRAHEKVAQSLEGINQSMTARQGSQNYNGNP